MYMARCCLQCNNVSYAKNQSQRAGCYLQCSTAVIFFAKANKNKNKKNKKKTALRVLSGKTECGCVLPRSKEGQGREYTEKDSEYVPTIPTPSPSTQPRKRRTRGSVKLRASSVPLNIPRKQKKQILPIIDEESNETFNGNLEKELADVNSKNLPEMSDGFNGMLPKGILSRFVWQKFTVAIYCKNSKISVLFVFFVCTVRIKWKSSEINLLLYKIKQQQTSGES